MYILQCTTMYYNVPTMYYNVLQCTTMYYNILQYTTMYYTVLHCTRYTALNCTTMYYYVLMYTAVIGDTSLDSVSDNLLAGPSGTMYWASRPYAMALPESLDCLSTGPWLRVPLGVIGALRRWQ
jgi:hypothetical protein